MIATLQLFGKITMLLISVYVLLSEPIAGYKPVLNHASNACTPYAGSSVCAASDPLALIPFFFGTTPRISSNSANQHN